MHQTHLKLAGKVAVITGAGSGIGAATAKVFTQLGASIAMTGSTKSKLENTLMECQKVSVGQPTFLMVIGDIRDSDVREKIIDDTMQTFGKLDTLVNNAGIYRKSTLLQEGSLADYDELFDVNLRSLVALTQLAAPHLINTKGSIINNSSICGKGVTFGNMYYGMTKAALDHFTKHAAREFGPHQVRVNSVSPGLIESNIFGAIGVKSEEIPKFFNRFAKLHVLGRVGKGSEVARAIAFLASDDASFISGADILVDGGMLVNPLTPPENDIV